ncbi:MAG: hypothetical protein P8X82_03575 [Gemmatimonadales bacterium]
MRLLRWRRVRVLGTVERPHGTEIEYHTRSRILPESACIRVDRLRLFGKLFPYLIWFDCHIAAFPCEKAKHCHFVVLISVKSESLLVSAVGENSLIQLRNLKRRAHAFSIILLQDMNELVKQPF